MELKKKFMLRGTAIGCIVQHQGSVWIGVLNFVIQFNPETFQRQALMKVGLGMVNCLVGYRKYLWISSRCSSRVCVWNFMVRIACYCLILF